jgi:hypothetical protein
MPDDLGTFLPVDQQGDIVDKKIKVVWYFQPVARHIYIIKRVLYGPFQDLM